MFSDYWLHNKGAAPVGYQPVTVQIKPSLVAGQGPFKLPVVVASEWTDDAAAGSVTFVAPAGWEVAPAQRVFRLAAGAHLAFDATVTPARNAAAGRYFVAARIEDAAGQVHEDVVRIDYLPAGRTNGKATETDLRSAILYAAVARAMKPTGGEPQTKPPADGLATDDSGAELEVELVGGEVRLRAGERGSVQVGLRNRAASEIRGEAQIISPHETWPAITPWTQGFEVAAGSEATVTFAVEPPFDFPRGTWWALVKVMYFGRLTYTESVPIEVAAATRVETPVPA